MTAIEESLQLPMPTSLESETGILGAILLSPGLIFEASSKLRIDDFSSDANQRIFAHMINLSDRCEPIDTTTLTEALLSHGKLGTAGGRAYLEEIQMLAVKRSSVAYYCSTIRAKAVLRGYIKLGERLSLQAYDPMADAAEIGASIQESLLELQTSGGQFRRIAEVMTEAVAELAGYRNAPDTGSLGLTTTIEGLDTGTSGIRGSEFWVIGARPNVGKTPFGMQVAIAQARKKIPVLVFSLEMQDTQLACRCLSHAGIAKPRHVRDPRFVGPTIWNDIENAPQVVADWPLWIDDTPDLTIKALRHKARYAVAKHGVKLIVVDYLQLVMAPGKSEYDRVTAVAKGLRLLARETKCPILALSQLNREAKDLNTAPGLGDLRSSGEIEQSANVVGLLHRPPDNTLGTEMLGLKGKLIMAKIREGAGGPIDVRFDIDTLTFKGGWNQ